MPVFIYLRAIKHNGNYHLAMFDSNGDGAIDNLTTIVNPGYTIYWKKDRQSGITKIRKIYSNAANKHVFRHKPTPVNGGFKLAVPHGINIGHSRPIIEKYFIECTLTARNPDGTHIILNIDPYIKIPPPPTNG